MNRRWKINREHIHYLIDKSFKGSLSAFGARTGVDKNTLRRWLRKDAATTYGSTVLQLSRALKMPAAAFAYQQRETCQPPPDWLRAFRDLSGSSMGFMSVGAVMAEDTEHPYVRSWPYEKPLANCWGTLVLQHDEPEIDIELFGTRSVCQTNVSIKLAQLSLRHDHCDVVTSWPPRLSTWVVHEPQSLRIALVYDDWPAGFMARASAPFSIVEGAPLCGGEVARLTERTPQLVPIEPLAVQVTPPMSSPACRHCFEDTSAKPPYMRATYGPRPGNGTFGSDSTPSPVGDPR